MSPILPIALLGGGALLLLSSKKKEPTTAPITPGTTTPGVTTTPSAGPTLSTNMKKAIANALKGLGINPETGAVTGTATPDAIEAATALAALLEAQGFPDAAQSLRDYATAAAASVKVDPPEQFSALPAELSTELTRALQLEGDPKRIRALVKRVRESKWGTNPQIMAVLAALEARATQLEKEQDAAQTADEVDEIVHRQDDFTLPAPKPITVPTPVSTPSIPLPTVIPSTTALVYVETLRYGSKGDHVKKYQAALAQAGFNPGAADGIYGAKSVAATQAFQRSEGLTVDGLAGKNTYTALNRKLGGVTATIPTTTVPTATIPAAVTSVVAPVVSAALVYTVKAGDWGASKIAKDLTGDASRWPELKAENIAQQDISKRLFVGDRLKIPASWVPVIQSRGITVSGAWL